MAQGIRVLAIFLLTLLAHRPHRSLASSTALTADGAARRRDGIHIHGRDDESRDAKRRRRAQAAALTLLPGDVVLRLNCGSLTNGTDSAGESWLADGPFVSSGTESSNAAMYGRSLDGAGDLTAFPSLYDWERWDPPGGPEMGYSLPVPVDGEYVIRLYLAERSQTAVGERVFDVFAAGRMAATDVDIFALAGGAGRPIVLNMSGLEGRDGSINLTFLRAEGNPIVSGIEVVYAGLPITPEPTSEPTSQPTVERTEAPTEKPVTSAPTEAPVAVTSAHTDGPTEEETQPAQDSTDGPVAASDGQTAEPRDAETETASAPTERPGTSAPTASPSPWTMEWEDPDRPCGCETCTPFHLAAWPNNLVSEGDDGSCAGRVGWVMRNFNETEREACVRVAHDEFPFVCGPYCDPEVCEDVAVPDPPPKNCGCNSCTEQKLAVFAFDVNGGYTCGSRIGWLQSPEGGSKSEHDACIQIAGSEFPDVCGPDCDPSRCNGVQEYLPAPDPAKLVWSDEFEQDGAPDCSKWTHHVGRSVGVERHELQFYTDRLENGYVQDGVLRIRAVREGFLSGAYTSGRLQSFQLGRFRYGHVQVRARLRDATAFGTRAIIKMVPTTYTYGTWPSSGEINIMTHVGHDKDRFHGYVHTESFNQAKIGGTLIAEAEDWHTFEILWNVDSIAFAVDGRKYSEYRRGPDATYREWPFDRDFYLLLHLTVGGNEGGVMGVDTESFEGTGQIMEVDYVRVFRVSASAAAGLPRWGGMWVSVAAVLVPACYFAFAA